MPPALGFAARAPTGLVGIRRDAAAPGRARVAAVSENVGRFPYRGRPVRYRCRDRLSVAGRKRVTADDELQRILAATITPGFCRP